MTVDPLSIEAYSDMDSKRECQQAILLYVIKRATHPSSADLERITKINRASITGRLRELEDAGKIAKMGKKKDPFTKVTVNWYGVVE